MASLLDVGNCDINSKLNTGIPFCDFKKDRIFGMIFLDDGVVIPATSLVSQAGVLTWLQTAAQADRGQRAYPFIGYLNNFDSQTPEPTRASIGNLTTKQRIVDDPIPVLSFAHSKGELMQKKLQQLETGNYDVIFVDRKFNLIGVNVNGDLGGYSIDETYVFPGNFLGSDAVNQYRFDITLGSFQEFKYNSSMFVASSAIGNVQGLNNVVLSLFNQVANVVKVLAIADGNKNLFDLTGIRTALTNVTNWTLVNDAGTPVTITSIAVTDTVNKVFTVTIDSTAYGAAASGAKFYLNFNTPANLKTAGIVGFESTGPVVITKP